MDRGGALNPEIAAARDRVAEAALKLVEPGMVVGLGTGDTARRFVERLGVRSKAEGLGLTCVATSAQPEAVARAAGLIIKSLLEPGVGNDDVSLFYMDATCGHGSYHGGRYVNVEKQADGRYLVDFNNGYNPSCSYSPHYNCPIPPLENRLTVKIPAGESWSEEGH